jgi:hypothetical protein
VIKLDKFSLLHARRVGGYPLELLRNTALANKEQEIAFQLWQDFMKGMSASGSGREK